MRAALLLLLVALTGCKAEKSFDERYADTQKSINAKAGAIDDELAARAKQQEEIDRALATPTPATGVPPASRR